MRTIQTILIGLGLLCLVSCSSTAKPKNIAERVATKDFPSIFMAWYNIDMPEYPLLTEEQRIVACAKHDLMWEEPLSQLGEKVEVVLGLIWDHHHHGLATSFTEESLQRAKHNKERLLELNPNMVCLFEIRWRDAPSSFLPDDSPWWMRKDGEVVMGWLGGWEPFRMLDYNNPEFQDNVARQAKIAVECGVYDGVMLDWSGNLEIIKKIRLAIGDQKLIIVNIHDDIEDGILYKDYINGSFMELNPIDEVSLSVEELVINHNGDRNKRNWTRTEEALRWFEENLLEPRINCLEVWGHRKDIRRMRATTTLGLTMSDGYVLYGDPNPLATPDHLHDWYPLWDVQLGKPLEKGIQLENGSWFRRYEGGIVIYNPYANDPISHVFEGEYKRVTTGETGSTFGIASNDGDIFVKP